MERIDQFGVWADAERHEIPATAAAELAPVLGAFLGFVWVYRAGGYAKAARLFPYPITQPGLHRQVGALEEALKVELFVRGNGRNVVPTHAGRQLYRWLLPLFTRLSEGLARLRNVLDGELRIHASRMVLDSVLPAWVRRCSQKHPRLVIALHELRAPSVELLHEGVADVLIAHYGGRNDAGITRTPVCVLRPYLVTSDGKTPRISGLRDTPFVAYRADLEGHALQLAALERLELAPRTAAMVDSASTALSLVQARCGFSIVPALSAADIGARGLGVLDLSRYIGEQPFTVDAMTTAAAREHDPLIAAFMACAPKISGVRRSRAPQRPAHRPAR